MERRENAPADGGWNAAAPEAAYRSVSSMAILSLVVALFSPLMLFDVVVFSCVPIAAIGLGWLALRAIHNRPADLGGAWAARSGIALAVVLGGVTFLWAAWARAQEIPSGYTAVTYQNLEPDPDKAGELIPAKAYELNDQKIYVKGYMEPGRQTFRLKKFKMSRDNGVCKFCMPQVRPTDRIDVTLVGDLQVNYTSRLVGVGGKLHVEPLEKAAAYGGVAYRLEADFFRVQ